jgi:ABC-2 type transport system ATP-binding protein
MTRLHFQHVSKWYRQVSALMDVSFEVGAEVLGLVGRNGAGKSTLMKLACGLLSPSEGNVLIGDLPPTHPDARQLLGFCPDFDSLCANATGLQFVTWMLRLHGYSGRKARTRAGEVLEQLGLGEHMHRQVRQYSKGMRQRVRLGQALAHAPKVVLLDEPMNGLDPVARHELQHIIQALAAQGVAVVVSSHVLHELDAMVDRVALMDQGRLVAEGTVGDLRAQLDQKPHRLLLRTDSPRELAAKLATLPQVSGLQFTPIGIEVSVGGQGGFYRELTAIGAAPEDLVREVVPLDDSLASVFGYLVG